eukprot:TRINITY_DN14267_c0_g2_i1.p1 TRINITY_DN14267_c0_g2~~TRINITY_DN14267_c0_g2_i1.p1  ORF type:complete len:695 (-),score=74.40 TRINITY_DN14267_c0_g2_i1:149-2233(-)
MLSPQVVSSANRNGERKLPVHTPSLGVPGFDDDFDHFFKVRSDFLDVALSGGLCPDSDAHERCKPITDFKLNPKYWGIRAETIWLLWCYVAGDAQGYAAAHQLSDDFCSVCLSDVCEWHHHNTCTRSSQKHQLGSRQMQADMHLIVDRYIKPWTRDYSDTGLALAMSTARLCDSGGFIAEELCVATVFVSHCWNESFEEFATTIQAEMDPDRVVWVCSFAICQHNKFVVPDDFCSLPFHQAMQSVERVVAVTDSACEVFGRCWCVFEASLALQLDIPYDIVLSADDDDHMWHSVAAKLVKVDVRTCSATEDTDKQRILTYARAQKGGIDVVNKHIREVAKEAACRAELRSAAKHGDMGHILRLKSVEEVRDWVTGRRRRTLSHILALHSRVHALNDMLDMTGDAHLNAQDCHGQTPLSVATEHGSLASVTFLLTRRACPDIPSSSGLTPLHYGSMHGNWGVTELLLMHSADVNARGHWDAGRGHTPLSLAVYHGNAEIVRELLKHLADPEIEIDGLPLLHLAAKRGHPEVTVALLATRVSPDRREATTLGRTALMYAAKNGFVAVCSILLWAKSDADAKDSRGRSVQDYCGQCERDQARTELLKVIRAHGNPTTADAPRLQVGAAAGSRTEGPTFPPAAARPRAEAVPRSRGVEAETFLVDLRRRLGSQQGALQAVCSRSEAALARLSISSRAG